MIRRSRTEPWRGQCRATRIVAARRVLAAVGVCAVSLFGASCCPNPGDIFPTTVGSVWNMDLVLVAWSAFQGYDTVETGTITTSAVEKTNLANGLEVVKYRSDVSIHLSASDSTYSSTTCSYYRDSDGWILNYATTDDSAGDTVVMTDPKVGTTWGQGTNGSALVVGQEDITVKAGTYKKAWKVKTTTTVNGLAVDTYMWYARGTGLVKVSSEYSLGIYSEVYDQELTSAVVK